MVREHRQTAKLIYSLVYFVSILPGNYLVYAHRQPFYIRELLFSIYIYILKNYKVNILVYSLNL